MAELNTLEEKLAEVLGLAQVAQGATEKVEGDGERPGARERAATDARGGFGDRGALHCARRRARGQENGDSRKARETKQEAEEMMSTYLGSDAEGLDGFEFLTMAEAAEVAHWAVLAKLNENAGEEPIRKLVAWALPIQERHFNDVKIGSLKLASEEDPYH